ncbi:alkaline phosphatase family protein [uncultured Polaribacter sp.]|uniref:LTA synthase family protein n=1 Tax=uncultured Polaribacter sp. TaxID=174711 RepID=UPI002625AFFD|nr:alkaline phosphatase family protein [uncultured Polaribacter sp.]
MRSFKNRILFYISYFLLWVSYFVFARSFFLVFNFSSTKELDTSTIINTFYYGLKLDISFAAYLSIIPFLLFIISVFTTTNYLGKIVKIYSYIILAIITVLLLTDAGLYQSWGVRLDNSILPYLDKPMLMLASVSKGLLAFGIFAWLLITIGFCWFFKKVINNKTIVIAKSHWAQAILFLVTTASLILPIRGGLQTNPINQSNVYFSSSMFANHAAINFTWNFFNTITHRTNGINVYKSLDDKIAKNIIKKNRKPLLNADTDNILNTKKPNVILIIWEGLTAKVVGALNGESNVTPNLNALSKEGLLFTNFYANGDRTDKGIPAILSGYYPLPVKRIMRMPNKTRSLPMLPKQMEDLGYKTKFYYGGDLNFANMKTYLRNAQINNFVDGSFFKNDDWNSKWGAHDHVVLQKFAKDFENKQTHPFFKILLTLTSHEPFEFPDVYKFGKDTEDNKFRSSHTYTDKAVGNFIKFAKQQPWYKNTLIIILADHGHSLPKHEGLFNDPKKFKIPMLWLGGALTKTNLTVDNYTNQIDLPYTLLDLLDGDNSAFKWSKNLFNNSKNQFSYFSFNKGFGTISKNGTIVYDLVGKTPILEIGNTKTLDSLGKAISQEVYQDFLDRK